MSGPICTECRTAYLQNGHQPGSVACLRAQLAALRPIADAARGYLAAQAALVAAGLSQERPAAAKRLADAWIALNRYAPASDNTAIRQPAPTTTGSCAFTSSGVCVNHPDGNHDPASPRFVSPCTACGGLGRVGDHPCPTCEGSGLERISHHQV